MNCPEHLIFQTRFCRLWHIQRADIPRRFVTWAEALNPLRYELAIGPGPGRFFVINRDARWNLAFANLRWRLWGRRRFERNKRP